ncbi:hypothetical protein D1B17_10605 [Companilactobacillus zhachilii]|uniref:Uncharacterized protein n=1 Tax=Companilactobacillus zhachilii TaxID=2304606 RepID=A0A386PSS9_9LACO|nr:hypothetical protein [Companilactobacillus zhachilii]AYE39054.1 hypothetical protein D1B17_10605 [Companilactobacillus zhachilii]
MENDIEIRNKLDISKPPFYEYLLEYIDVIAQVLLWTMVYSFKINRTFYIVSTIFLLIIFVLSSLSCYKRYLFFKKARYLFDMTKTIGLGITNGLMAVIIFLFTIFFLFKCPLISMEILAILFLVSSTLNFLFSVMVEKVNNKMPLSVKKGIKKNILLNMIDNGDLDIRQKIFTKVLNSEITANKYSSYIFVTHERRRCWINFLKTLDSSTLFQMEYVIKQKLKYSPQWDKIISTFLKLTGFGYLFGLLVQFVSKLIQVGGINMIFLIAIMVMIILIMIIIEIVLYLKAHSDDKTNEFILSMLAEIKSMKIK